MTKINGSAPLNQAKFHFLVSNKSEKRNYNPNTDLDYNYIYIVIHNCDYIFLVSNTNKNFKKCVSAFFVLDSPKSRSQPRSRWEAKEKNIITIQKTRWKKIYNYNRNYNRTNVITIQNRINSTRIKTWKMSRQHFLCWTLLRVVSSPARGGGERGRPSSPYPPHPKGDDHPPSPKGVDHSHWISNSHILLISDNVEKILSYR